MIVRPPILIDEIDVVSGVAVARLLEIENRIYKKSQNRDQSR